MNLSDQIECNYIRHTTWPDLLQMQISEDIYSCIMPLSRGSVRVLKNGSLFFDGELQPGMLRLASPGERFEVSVRSEVRHVELKIPGANVRKALCKAGYSATRTRNLGSLLRPNQVVARIAAALRVASRLSRAQRQSYIDGLGQSLLACLMIGLHRDTTIQPSATCLSDREFTLCSQYADSMMQRRLSLSDWADTLAMDQAEFTRRFRRRTNQAPYAWFLNRRIERAKQLLQEQSIALADVAFGVGFCSQSHFSEAFRRRVGCSPARWRAHVLSRLNHPSTVAHPVS